jgi:hypothetical protein
MREKILSIILIVLGLAVVAGIGYYAYIMYFQAAPPEPPAGQEPQDQGQAEPEETGQNFPKGEDGGGGAVIEAGSGEEELETEEVSEKNLDEKDRILRLAISFAERFGSYSNQSDYGNITDLKIYMTKSMQEWADNFVTENRSNKTGAQEYYGIVTHAVSGEFIDLDDEKGVAEISVMTRRRELGENETVGGSFTQEIKLKLLRESGEWKIDKASWQ